MPKTVLTWKSIPTNGLVIIEGQRGQGKTALAWYIAEVKRLEKRGKRVISNAKPSIVIIDEAAFAANARRAMQESNLEWLQLISICRHKDHLLIFVSQHNRQLDVQILADADLVIMKKPSLLHLRFTRPEFKPEIQQAYEEFQTIKGDSRKFAYVVDYHNGNAKMLRCQLPKFWSDKISKAYSQMTIGLAPTKVINPPLNLELPAGIEEQVNAYANQTEPKKKRGRPRKVKV